MTGHGVKGHDGLSVIDEEATTQKLGLPDFGEPITTRDRASYHEPAQAVHYSDEEDKHVHARRDFAHSISAHFSRLPNAEKKKIKQMKKRHAKKHYSTSCASGGAPGGGVTDGALTFNRHARTKSETLVDSIVKDIHKEEDETPSSSDEVITTVPPPIPRTAEEDPIAYVPKELVTADAAQLKKLNIVTEDDTRQHHLSTNYNHQKHARHKKVKLEERRRTGDQIRGIIRQDIDPSANEGLPQADIDEQHAHRFDDVPGIRKHIIHRPMKKRVKLSH